MKTITLHHVLALIVTCFFLFCEVAVGQAVYGNINGTVNDPSGAAVANAAITITDTNRGINYQTTANESGNYEQTHLLAGHYKISASPDSAWPRPLLTFRSIPQLASIFG